MRTIVKMILPAAAFMLASAGAVGTKAISSKEDKNAATILGYVHNPTASNCLVVEVDCQVAPTPNPCKAFIPERQVYRLNGSNQCVEMLWKVNP